MARIHNKKSYVWLTGHVRNVGDSMLRRPYLEIIEETSTAVVWAGNNAGYIRGLHSPTAAFEPSFSKWLFSFVWASLTGRPNFVFNAGEFGVTKQYFVGVTFLLPWIALAKLKGGKVVWLGAGVKNLRRGFSWPFTILLKLCDLVAWRESHSVVLMKTGYSMPDWAFLLGSQHLNEEPRTYLAISLRGDRNPPSKEWLDTVSELSERLKLRPIVITQVEDDDVRSREIAAHLNAELVPWTFDDHYQQEMLVRGWYRKSSLIFSDRLHGLIMAATEGCVPLGWVESATAKIDSHFDEVGTDWVHLGRVSPIAHISKLSVGGVERYQRLNHSAVGSARERLIRVKNQIQDVLDV